MKISNFLRFDPSYKGVGLTRGNKLEEEIWHAYWDKPSELKEIADELRSIAQDSQITLKLSSIDISESEEAREGRVLLKLHKFRERSRKLTKRKKEQIFKLTGCLKCEACRFDFAQFYGPIGRGFIECHHKTPIGQIKVEQKTTLEDLALVCANCHRMLHNTTPMLSIDELRDQLNAHA
jgi:5-methylcytosine-specific restriction protein A